MKENKEFLIVLCVAIIAITIIIFTSNNQNDNYLGQASKYMKEYNTKAEQSENFHFGEELSMFEAGLSENANLEMMKQNLVRDGR